MTTVPADILDSLNKAQRAWYACPPRDRAAVLLRVHDLVLDRQEELLDAIQKDTHKNRRSAFAEIMDVATTARYYAHIGPRHLRERRIPGAIPVATKTRATREPVGIVGIIAPWNYPLTLAVSDALPALMAGNAVLLKPDELGMRTATKALEILREAGVPRELMQLHPGGASAGQDVANSCDFLMFTGSSATGRAVGALAGERLIGWSGELGGKNPMIVTADADVDLAVRVAIDACFSNTGQLCISIERIYLHRQIAAEFTDRFLRAVAAMRVGPGPGWDIDMGGLVSREHLERVEAFVTQAVAEGGARVLAGARRLEEAGATFYAPTVLSGVDEKCDLYRREVFGPVVYLQEVDTHDEAIALANDSDFGLNACVVGAPRTAWAIARQLESGSININEGYAATWASIAATHGGWKDSGVGGRHGMEGLLQFTHPRTISEQRFVPLSGGNAPAAQTMTRLLRLGKHILP